MSLYKGTNLIAGHNILYNTTGQNTDGAMTQKVCTDELDNKLNKQQITNCILEAPNGVATYSGNVITVKAGLKVLIPNGRNADGTLNNIEHTVPADITHTESNGARTLFISSRGISGSAQTDRVQYLDYLPATVATTYAHRCYNYKTNLWYYTSGSTTADWQVEPNGAIPIVDSVVESNTITSFKPKYELDIIDKNMTDMLVDGTWSNAAVTLASSVTIPTSNNITYSLASYLPNDGYDYEVLLNGSVTTTTTNGSALELRVGSDLTRQIWVCGARTRAAANVFATGNVIIRVGANRSCYVSSHSSWTGTFGLAAASYRRLGKNQ